MKAFESNYIDTGVVMSESASKARYAFYLAAMDAGFDARLVDIPVKRAPQFDSGKTVFGVAENNRPYGKDFFVETPATQEIGG